MSQIFNRINDLPFTGTCLGSDAFLLVRFKEEGQNLTESENFCTDFFTTGEIAPILSSEEFQTADILSDFIFVEDFWLGIETNESHLLLADESSTRNISFFEDLEKLPWESDVEHIPFAGAVFQNPNPQLGFNNLNWTLVNQTQGVNGVLCREDESSRCFLKNEPVEKYLNESVFKFIPFDGNTEPIFSSALSICDEHGLQLAEIRSETEFNFLVDTLMFESDTIANDVERFNDFSEYWLGMTYNATLADVNISESFITNLEEVLNFTNGFAESDLLSFLSPFSKFPWFDEEPRNITGDAAVVIKRFRGRVLLKILPVNTVESVTGAICRGEVTEAPTTSPIINPTNSLTISPTINPTFSPTFVPTREPRDPINNIPSPNPSNAPPSNNPTSVPSLSNDTEGSSIFGNRDFGFMGTVVLLFLIILILLVKRKDQGNNDTPKQNHDRGENNLVLDVSQPYTANGVGDDSVSMISGLTALQRKRSGDDLGSVQSRRSNVTAADKANSIMIKSIISNPSHLTDLSRKLLRVSPFVKNSKNMKEISLFLQDVEKYLESQLVEETMEPQDEYNSFDEFNSEEIPDISLRRYMQRLLNGLDMWFNDERVEEDENVGIRALLLCLHLITKVCDDYSLTRYNIHKLLCITVLVAAKFIEDEIITNDYWADIAGITLEEVTSLEQIFCFSLNFNFEIEETDVQMSLKKFRL